MRLSRRRFLLGGIVAATAAAAGGLGVSMAAARAVDLVTPESGRPAKVAAPRKVVVVGGGLAGLSAAIELAERGFQVTLLEAGAACGGRVGGWSARVGGVEVPLEHGFHGFFTHYYSLNDLIRRACDPRDFKPVEAYPVATKGRPVDLLRPFRAGFPANLLRVLADSANLSLTDVMPHGEHVLEFLRYHPTRTFDAYDGVSFEEWCRQRQVPPALLELFYRPFARTLFNPLDRFSTAEVIQLFHAYFMGNPEGIGFQVLDRSAPEALVGPLVAHLERLGGQVRTGSPVQALAIDGERVAGVVLRRDGELERVATVPVESVPALGYAMVSSSRGLIYIGRRGADFVAIDARCTHQGCPVLWRPEENGFRCPCHQGRFDAAGLPIGGPPKTPLATLTVVPRGDELEVLSTQGTREERLPAEYVVLATDVKGTRAIVAATRWPERFAAWQASVGALELAPPYLVARQWLDRPVQPDRHPLYTVAGYRYLDVLALYSRFQEPFRSQAGAGGGAVIETHAYALEPGEGSAIDAICDTLLEESAAILPELTGARAVHREVQWLDNFTGYGVGAQGRRPRTVTPAPNLVLAGDWVRLDLPVELMERAVVSGRLAANVLLEEEGVQQVAIRCVPLEGILA